MAQGTYTTEPAPIPADIAVLQNRRELWIASSAPTAQLTPTAENLSLRGLMEALFRHHRTFVRILIAVMVATVVVTFLIPRAFESRMKILVLNARKNASITPDKTERVITNDAVTEEEINSEVQLIDSNDLLESVIKKLEGNGLDPARLEKAVSELEKRLKINPIHKSNVIEVEYLDRSPERATHVLQLISAAYLDKHLQLQRPTGAYEFFQGEANRYQQQLETAEAQLADFEKSQNFVGLGDKKDVLMKQINQTEDEIRSSDATVDEMNQRLTTSAALAHAMAPRIPTQTRIMPNQNAAQTLNTMLVELKNRRTSMLTKFRPEDRLVKELDEQIALTSKTLDTVSRSSATETTSDVNTVWQELNSARAKDEISRNGQTARRAILSKQLKTSQADLANLQTLTVQYNTLSRRVQELDTNYKTFAEKRDEAQIADAMDRQKLLNVAVAEPPTSSTVAIRPRLLLNLALGLFTAVFMAAGAVFLAELLRENFRTPHELEAWRGFPVLATVPLQSGRRTIPASQRHWLPESEDAERRSARSGLLNAAVFQRNPRDIA